MKMIRLLTLFLFATYPFLYSDLEDHFKKVPDKSGSHQMRNIDFIYMINLDERPEKYLASLQQLAPYHISPCRFSAVNGWNLSLEAINEIGVKYESWMQNEKLGTTYSIENNGKESHELLQTIGKTYFCHCMPLGSIGIVLSHLSILQDAMDSDYQTIWVMEDDIEIIRDPQILSDLIDELDALVGKDGWDILFTDQDTKAQDGNYVPCFSYAWRPNFIPRHPEKFAERSVIHPNFSRVGARYGAYSMIVRRSGMKKILNFLKNYHVFLPYDMEFTQPPNIRLFTVTQDVVSTMPMALSDNGSPNFRNPSSIHK